jgi:MoxR-like ATPase
MTTSHTPTAAAPDLAALERRIEASSEPFRGLLTQMRRVIVGQDALLDGLLIGLLANGHLLIEGVPGLAKTTAVAALAAGIRTGFQRVQFTPDLLPADLIGTLVYQPGSTGNGGAGGGFTVKKGPIFTNLVLADEINRAPAKVQSALLEAMQERQVTIGSETYRLPDPFLVMATQNPIEQEGTYPLPEAQVDRFMLKLVVGYPTPREERLILDRMASTVATPTVEPVLDPAAIIEARAVADSIFVDDRIKDYIVRLVVATRDPASGKVPIKGLVEFGASPRATLNLLRAAKAKAFLAGRGFVLPQDVKDIAPEVLRHRVTLTYEAEAENRTGDDIVRAILDHVAVP